MAPKIVLVGVALVAVALAGCTGGGGDGNGGNTTSGTGGVGVGGTVSGPGGGVGGNATVSGSGTTTNGTAANMTEAVTIENNQYMPSTVTVQVGGTVTWTHNDGTMRHTVTADDGSFDSSPSCNQPVTPLSDCMDQGDDFSATFTAPGEYTYHCKVHTSMSGTVRVVQP